MKPIPEMTGAELNEAMAVEVRGWHRQECNDGWKDHSPSEIWVEQSGKLTGYNYLNPWHPTHDLNQAWEALEKFREGRELYTAIGIHHDGEHYAEIEDVAKDKLIGRSGNNNLARAICEALLMAVREEQG